MAILDLLEVAPIQGRNKWLLAGYGGEEKGTSSGKRGTRFVLKDGKTTVLVTSRQLLRAIGEYELQHGTVNGCQVEFNCAGAGLARTYGEIKCEPWVQEKTV